MSNPETPDPGRNPLDRIESWLSRTASVLAGSAVPESNYDPSRHGALTRFDGLDGYEELERYWLNAPYAFASINHSTQDDEYHYHVVEPSLDAFALFLCLDKPGPRDGRAPLPRRRALPLGVRVRAPGSPVRGHPRAAHLPRGRRLGPRAGAAGGARRPAGGVRRRHRQRDVLPALLLPLSLLPGLRPHRSADVRPGHRGHLL